jgi:hypothetical protein
MVNCGIFCGRKLLTVSFLDSDPYFYSIVAVPEPHRITVPTTQHWTKL